MDTARCAGDDGRDANGVDDARRAAAGSEGRRHAPAGGLRQAAGRWASLLIAAGRTRLELALLELEDARQHLERLWIGAIVTLFLGFITCALLLTALMLAVEPSHRGIWAGALGLLFAAATAAGAWHWSGLVRKRRPWLADSLQALRDDESAFGGDFGSGKAGPQAAARHPPGSPWRSVTVPPSGPTSGIPRADADRRAQASTDPSTRGGTPGG